MVTRDRLIDPLRQASSLTMVTAAPRIAAALGYDIDQALEVKLHNDLLVPRSGEGESPGRGRHPHPIGHTIEPV
jgi:hypothetical protein